MQQRAELKAEQSAYLPAKPEESHQIQGHYAQPANIAGLDLRKGQFLESRRCL